jgi:hypothetical protein
MEADPGVGEYDVGFTTQVSEWLQNSLADDLNEQDDIIMISECKVIPGQWGFSHWISADKVDRLKLYESIVDPIVIYSIIESLMKSYPLKITRVAYFINDDGLKIPYDAGLAETNPEPLYLELQFWLDDWRNFVDDANSYLRLFYSLQERIQIEQMRSIQLFYSELLGALKYQKRKEITLNREKIVDALSNAGIKPPKDNHRNEDNGQLALRFEGFKTIWHMFDTDYKKYVEGFEYFMELRNLSSDLAHEVHNNIKELGEFILHYKYNKSEIRYLKTKANDLRNFVFDIQKFIVQKFGRTTNGKSTQNVIRQLSDEGKIGVDVEASLKYMFNLTSGLQKAGKDTLEDRTASYNMPYLYDTLRMGYDFIFRNILPILRNL